MRPRWTVGLGTLLCLAVPSVAHAHLVNSGLGPFYDGSLHLLLSPGDLLGLFALTLLAGLRGAAAGRMTVILLPAAWLVAGVVGLGLPTSVELPWLSTGSLVFLGALVAADPRLPPLTVGLLGVLYGALHGLLNGSAVRVTGAGPLTLLGIVGTALVVALLTSAAVVSLRPAWTRIAVRVAGSWVAAVGILMLGWLAREAG